MYAERTIFYTQFAFQLCDDGFNLAHISEHLTNLGVQLFAPISRNINWENPSNWICTKCIFRKLSRHLHLSATSNQIGNNPEYTHKSMVGSSALLTFGLWASKISHLNQDPSSYGTYAITMVQGKNNKKVSFISAYIAVQKGSNIGVDSLYAQQVMVYECKCHQSNILPSHSFCPRSDAIK